MSDWKPLGVNPHLIRCPICAAALIDAEDEKVHRKYHEDLAILLFPNRYVRRSDGYVYIKTQAEQQEFSDSLGADHYQNEMRRG